MQTPVQAWASVNIMKWPDFLKFEYCDHSSYEYMYVLQLAVAMYVTR